MITQKYVLTSERFSGSVLFGYDINGYLTEFLIEGELNDKQLAWLYANLPTDEPMCMMLPKATATVKVEKQPLDLSFERFWNTFQHKVGNRANAMKIWNKLSEIDKIKAFNSIKPYLKYISKKGINQVYPETYINQRRWENEF